MDLEKNPDAYRRLSTDDLDSIIDSDHIYDDRDEFEDDDEDLNWKRRAFSTTVNKIRWLFECILVLTVVALLCLLLQANSKHERPLSVADDVTGFAPTFTQKVVSFSPDESFVPQNTTHFFDKATAQRWLTIVPRGLGFIKVEHPEEFHDLPNRLDPSHDEYIFTTSMTHQLHCLYHIARSYANLHAHGIGASGDGHWHLMHCFDYIRQGIMCAGDVALEGKATTFPGNLPGSDGWDAKHICKDYSEVYDYLEEHRAHDMHWI